MNLWTMYLDHKARLEFRSPMELRLATALMAGMEHDVALMSNERILGWSGKQYLADIIIAWPVFPGPRAARHTFIVECDGRAYHENKAKDEERDVDILNNGQIDTVYRFTGSMIFSHLVDVVYAMSVLEPEAFGRDAARRMRARGSGGSYFFDEKEIADRTAVAAMKTAMQDIDTRPSRAATEALANRRAGAQWLKIDYEKTAEYVSWRTESDEHYAHRTRPVSSLRHHPNTAAIPFQEAFREASRTVTSEDCH